MGTEEVKQRSTLKSLFDGTRDLLLTNTRFNYVCAILSHIAVACVLIKAGLWILRAALPQIEIGPVDYNTYQCGTKSPAPGNEFYVYAFSKNTAVIIARNLCAKAKTAPVFAHVTARWRHIDSDRLGTLLEKYDLLVSGPDVMTPFESQHQLFYSVAEYESYEAVLLSRRPIASLDRAQIGDLRIGLLSNRRSQSGYLAAREAFEKAHFSLDTLNIQYFPAHHEARQALEEGKVDLIATYWNPDQDSSRFSGFHRKTLRSAQGYRWYLARRWAGTTVECAVTDALRLIKEKATTDYFRRLRILVECNSR